MIKAIKFISSAIGRNRGGSPSNDTRFAIVTEGKITLSNGVITCCAPIDTDITAYPDAKLFAKAVTRCKGDATMYLTEAGRLCVRSDGFKAFIDCLPYRYELGEPVGDVYKLPSNFIDTISKLCSFIGENEAQPWTNGLLLQGQSCFATNNVVLLEAWLGDVNLPPTLVPKNCIDELIKIKEPPVSIQISGNYSATFNYNGGRWLRANLTGAKWPDVVTMLNNGAAATGGMQAVNKDMVATISDARAFVEGDHGHLFLASGTVSTSPVPGDGVELGAPCIIHSGRYNAKQLLAVLSIANMIDLSMYPKPIPFYGEAVRGLMVSVAP